MHLENAIPQPEISVSKVAPPELLTVVAYGCSTETACSNNLCSCKSASLSRTSYFKYEGLTDNCHNPHTASTATDDEDEETTVADD